MDNDDQTAANVVQDAGGNPVQDADTQINNTNVTVNNQNEQPPSGAISTAVVAEPDHAADISLNTMNRPEAEKTFSYNSQNRKAYDTSVTTSTAQAGNGKTISATWDAEYKMADGYKANDKEDYSWNKLAADMAQLDYNQQEATARYESVQNKVALDAAASQAWNEYFGARYSANQTQDKMGWTGGAKTASDLQVAFLQAETAANMYTKDEAQRYGVETKLGVARMYAEANQKALALQYYQDAVQQALDEASITGFYIEPEASEMMKQQEIANKILADPNSTEEAKERANQVNINAEAYYKSLGFQTGYRYETDSDGNTVKDKNGNPKIISELRGVKTLSLLSQEETIRNNKVMEKLQEQANKAAASAASASWAGVKAQRTLGTITQLQDIMTKGTLVAGTNDTYDYGDGYRYKITSSKTFKNLGKTPK
ncbi:MAG: hypothetical protein J6Y28_08030 [Acholeplasmatales bacterium]|nr:hypothetical protein [Acholeplasmatales bacterium]